MLRISSGARHHKAEIGSLRCCAKLNLRVSRLGKLHRCQQLQHHDPTTNALQQASYSLFLWGILWGLSRDGSVFRIKRAIGLRKLQNYFQQKLSSSKAIRVNVSFWWLWSTPPLNLRNKFSHRYGKVEKSTKNMPLSGQSYFPTTLAESFAV